MRWIVVVDDESDILSILSDVLKTEGYEPATFTSAARALDNMTRTRPLLLLTDLLMPGMSGQELIARVRSLYGNTLPIVVMSASVNAGAVVDLPIQAFLSKPFDLDELIEVIARCLAAKRAPSTAPVTGNLRGHRT